MPMKNRRLRLVVLVVLLVAGFLLYDRQSKSPAQSLFSGATMGTVYNIKVAGNLSQQQTEAVKSAIESALSDVDAKMSTYKSDSELSRFNAHTGTGAFTVSAETASVFELAIQISEQSGGAFDITVGPLVNAWGFGPDGTNPSPPTDEELKALSQSVGYEKIQVDTVANTIQKSHPQTSCDLSAIAKGFAVDQVAAALDSLGHRNYMVEVGGEVRTRGKGTSGAWRIGIEQPLRTSRSLGRIVELSGKALATSGDYRNYYEVDGKRVSHTIDPRTSKPIAHSLASVSVIHETCALADAWATALMVLGPEEGYKVAEENNLAAYFLIHDKEDKFTEKETDAFKEQS